MMGQESDSKHVPSDHNWQAGLKVSTAAHGLHGIQPMDLANAATEQFARA
jgi:hypothetical protein